MNSALIVKQSEKPFNAAEILHVGVVSANTTVHAL